MKYRLMTFLMLVLGFLLIVGCADLKVRAGQEVMVAQLDVLEVGQSTEMDVRDALGPPFGIGRSYLPFQTEYTDLWSYYYDVGTMEDDRRTFLFVFINDGVYEGHMWFSSLPDVG